MCFFKFIFIFDEKNFLFDLDKFCFCNNNVTINKAQKITYGMTNGEIDLSEGYIAKLQERAAKKLEGFMKEMRGAIVH